MLWFVIFAIGAIVIIVPLYYLAKSGQAAPYSWYPWASLALVAVSAGEDPTGSTPASHQN